MYLKLIDEQLKEFYKNYNIPFYVYISLTNYCNANCVFCDVRQNTCKKNNIDVKRLIDELSEMGVKYIHFTGGGEPFVNDDIFDYLNYCTQKGIKINVITNGLNLNEEKIQRLSKFNMSNIFLSIDSYDKKIHDELRRTKGLWEKATTNINLIKKYIPNVKIILNHVLNKKNIDDFDKFIKMKENVNFDFINPIIIKDCEELFPSDSQIKNYNEKIKNYNTLALENNIKFLCDNINFFESEIDINGDRQEKIDLKCIVPNYCAFVDCPTGNVYPCDCSIHRDRKIYNIGNLNKQTFKEIWYGEKKKSLSKLLLAGKLNCKLKCDECNCLFNEKYFESR